MTDMGIKLTTPIGRLGEAKWPEGFFIATPHI
jgi:hypothetical protein